MAAPVTLDLSRPCAHLRELAGLSLSQAAERLGYSVASSVHTAERREGVDAQGCTLGTLLRRADAYGLDLVILVTLPTM